MTHKFIFLLMLQISKLYSIQLQCIIKSVAIRCDAFTLHLFLLRYLR